jgi:hypothetical protein
MTFAFCSAIFAQQSDVSCPEIRFIGPSASLMSGDTAIFYVTIGNRSTNEYQYDWKVTAGTILQGQGTSRIEISTSGLPSIEISVSVKISSLPAGCVDIGSDIVKIRRPLNIDLFNEFGKMTQGQVRAVLDNFLIHLLNDPSSKGVIVLRPAKSWPVSKKISFVKLRYQHILYRKFDKSRISFAIDILNKEDDELMVLWPISPGMQVPNLEVGTVIVRAEDLMKELPTLFKKKTAK